LSILQLEAMIIEYLNNIVGPIPGAVLGVSGNPF